MAPEQIEVGRVDRRTDVFAASVVLWEAITGRRLFRGEGEAQVMNLVLNAPISPPSAFVAGVSPALDAVVMRGLERDPEARFASAEEMADALEEAAPPMPQRKLAAWIRSVLGDKLSARARLVQEIESASTGGKPDSPENGAQGADAADGSIDVTIARSTDEPPPQASSQASSISVETPRRASLPPSRPRLSPVLLGGGVAVCIGVAGLVIALRSHEASSPSAPGAPGQPTSTIPASTASPEPPPAEESAVPAAPSSSVAQAPASSTTAAATAPSSASTSRKAAPPVQRSSQPPPSATSKLYSRF
jgi:serine/threonine-protein kinase